MASTYHHTPEEAKEWVIKTLKEKEKEKKFSEFISKFKNGDVVETFKL
jgi:bisphosphoglycerate-independent phosphoglycerate mutase (AlkP superfamily)